MTFDNIFHYRPTRIATSNFRSASRALDEITRQFANRPVPSLVAPRPVLPRVRAVENETEYRVTAELPGVDGNDLEVFVEDGVLTITGKWQSDSSDKAEGADTGQSEEAERASFTRRIRFNAEIAEDAVTAQYRNGLLTVKVPKPEEPVAEVRSIPVQVG